MFIMNLKSRMMHEWWWVAIISGIIQFTNYFGVDITQYIGKDWKSLLDIVFKVLILIGVTVDTSTKGFSDKVIQGLTIQAINQATEVKEEVKAEDTTTSVNNTVTESSQNNSSNVSGTSSDKESETNSDNQATSNMQISSTDATNGQVVDVAALQAERDELKAQLDAVQSVVNRNVTI